MSKIAVDDGRNFPYTLLEFLYRKGGHEMKAKVRTPVGVAQRGCCADEQCEWIGTTSGESWPAADFDRLADQGYIAVRDLSDGHTSYRITQAGLSALRAHAEDDFCKLYGVSSVRAEDVSISRATFVGGCLAGYSLDTKSARDFIEFAEVNVWGQINGSDEPFLLAVAQLYFLDAEAALHLGGFSLEEVINSHPDTSHYRELICNHSLDGEPAQSVYELTDMFELEEAIGRQVIILHDMRVHAAFIGKRIGREVAQRLILRYGLGGGLVIAPLNPYGTKGKAAEEIVSRHLAKTSLSPHLKRHPFVPRTLVGDMRKLSRLP